MCEGSDSSEYLPEAEEVVQGGDDTDFEDEPVPLEIQPPVQTRVRKVCAKRAESSANMAPGERQAKRVRPSAPIEVSPGVSTESKRQHTSAQAKDNAQEKFPENNGANRPARPLMDQSYPDDAQGDDEREQGEEQTNQQTKSTDEVPWRRVLRKPTAATNGFKLPIFVAKGNRRPHEPVQAAKFASEAGVILRSQVPIFADWKQYKKQTEHFDNFMGKLAGRLGINTNDKPTKKACVSIFKSGVRQIRHRLKQAYFNGVPTNEIRTTSPVPYMTDAQWCELVETWSSDKNKAICAKNKRSRSKVKYHQATGSRSYVAHLHSFKENNKNKDPELGEELDAVEVFKDCHTSSKKGLSDMAREAISTMETMRTQPVADGQAPMSSVEVISKVLSHRSTTTFLKNVGIPTSSTKTETSTESVLQQEVGVEKQGLQSTMETMRTQPFADGQAPMSSVEVVSEVLSRNSSNTILKNVGIPTSSTKTKTSTESVLQQELASEKQGSADLRQEVEELKKKLDVVEQAWAKTQRELEEFKKQQEMHMLLLKDVFLNSFGLFY
ncbi:uncharacterized protein [Miscanthus floridulus]|uniref:uncharacterized protein isoform X2 n=1 Tax=Miscanthus floridulus TaxID=154761 RepID=UPI00345A068E